MKLISLTVVINDVSETTTNEDDTNGEIDEFKVFINSKLCLEVGNNDNSSIRDLEL